MYRVLTVDIGNTNIVVGAWFGSTLEYKYRIQTQRDLDETELRRAFLDMTRSHNPSGKCVYDGAILSSVVPEITGVTRNVLASITSGNVLLMEPGLDTGVDISDYQPGAIGMDRIVDMSAAIACYGGPVMVCDLGTCTTITVADEHRKIVGGMICPGIQMSLNAEAQYASQLPQLQATEATTLLGRDTASNMISGTVAATGLMISELARRQGNVKLVITGGLGELVMPWIQVDTEVVYEPDLLLSGLREIYLCNKERKYA